MYRRPNTGNFVQGFVAEETDDGAAGRGQSESHRKRLVSNFEQSATAKEFMPMLGCRGTG
jgi:hypothetical protein